MKHTPLWNATWWIAATTLLAMGLSHPPPHAAHAAHAAAQIGVVASAGKGSLRIRDGMRSPLRAGDTLQTGDRIESSDGPALVLLHQGAIKAAIRVKPHTIVTLTVASGAGIRIQLERGALLSDIHNPKKTPKPFEIRTRSAVMGVRGTVFFVHEHPGKELFLCTCAGEVSLTQPTGVEKSIRSSHHDAPVTIAPNGAMLAAPMGDEHSDAEATEIDQLLSGWKP